MRLLHLSDLHMDIPHLRDLRIVLKALFRDIHEDVTKNGPFDLVFFTGDLIFKGRYTDENVAAVSTEFMEPLLTAASIK